MSDESKGVWFYEENMEKSIIDFLASDKFFLLKAIYDSEKNAEINNAHNLCINDCGVKWEKKIHYHGIKKNIGHGEASNEINKLQEYGLLVTIPIKGNGKLVKLSPACKIIFEKLSEIARRIE